MEVVYRISVHKINIGREINLLLIRYKTRKERKKERKRE